MHGQCSAILADAVYLNLDTAAERRPK